MRFIPLAFAGLVCATQASFAQDALRGKLLYHDVGRVSGSGYSCIDCHGGVPGALHGLGKVANNPAAIAYAIGAIPQMTPLRDRLSARDMADIAAFVAAPGIASPQPRVVASGPAAPPHALDRLEFANEPAGSPPSALTLSNLGRVALRLGSEAMITGPDAAQFAVTASNCMAGQALATGESCTVSIVFRPVGAQGLRSATLHLAHDWIHGGFKVPLIGRVPP
jgi:cytochrome c553